MALPRLSLTARIFLSSAGIVIAVMAATLYLTQRSAEKAARQSIGRALLTTEQRVKELLSSEQNAITGRLNVFAISPDQRSNVEAARSNTDDAYKKLQDFVETAAEETGATWVQFVNDEGILRVRSDRPNVAQDTLTGSALVIAALNGETGEGFGATAQNQLIELESVPVKGAGDRLLGAVVAAKAVTDSRARAVGTQTDSEVLLFAFDTAGAPQTAAATEDARRVSGTLLAEAQRSMDADTGAVQQASMGDSAVAGAFNVIVGGETFVARRAMLNNAAGNPIGGFLTLRSLDRELAATGFADLRRTLLFSGAGGVALALLIGLLTARQVVRPVRLLADASRRAADGDYQAEIPAGGSDEIGTLSGAFRRLLADLKEKQALVDFMSTAAAPGGTRTQMLNAGSAATMKIPTGMENLPVLQPGQTFGNRYEIKSVLGVGGMGMVYKANDRELGEMLAIKTLKPEMIAADTNALERFKSEIKLARRIAHRNVVRTYDLGEIGGVYYISMEYVEGKSLKELIRERGRLPASAVLPIAKQLCRALEVSHEEGVIHRDIKPQNMVVQADGVLKVMDFGIARLATRPKESGHTEAGMVVGTPEYMAPEQLMGDELDARADLYATGVVLYECLVGRVPITADTPITLIAKVLEEEPKAPNAVQPDVPPALSELVMWVLAKDREKRPRSAAELHARLDAIALT
jgi:HAMP domain-containing protein/predicted Ser/Thr protein kinase